MRKYGKITNQLPQPEIYFLERLTKFYIKGNQIMARCPFHEDNNPSLSINLERGMFHCFGCGVRGGDIIDFEKQLFGISYKEALNSLSKGVFKHGKS